MRLNLLGIVAITTLVAAQEIDLSELTPCVRDCFVSALRMYECDNAECACEQRDRIGVEALICSSGCSFDGFFAAFRAERGLCDSENSATSRTPGDYNPYFDPRSLPGKANARRGDQAGRRPTANQNRDVKISAFPVLLKREKPAQGAATKGAVGFLGLAASLLLAL